MPGVYTYLDTPVIPVGAFAGPDRFPPDCEFPELTPRISQVSVTSNGVGGGPYVPTLGKQRDRVAGGDQTIEITSMGQVRCRTRTTAIRSEAPARQAPTRSTRPSAVTTGSARRGP